MKILAVLPRFPFPLDKGDKLRAYHQLRLLARHHDIYLFCTSEHAVSDSAKAEILTFCKEIRVVKMNPALCLANAAFSFLKGGSLQVGYWNSCRTRRAFLDFERRVAPDALYCQMVRTMPWVLKSPTFKVLDFQDALSMNTRRRMERSCGLWRLMLGYESKALQRTEQRAFRLFDRTTVISHIDQSHLSPNTVIVPNGVDTGYFDKNVAGQPDNRYDIVFCGNMSYAPNVDAARFLVHGIMPHVWRVLPSATLLLAGADPKSSVSSLASGRVTVSGRMADIRQAYASSQVFVAPMRLGSGLQNKLLEAMAMGLPCVTTSLANTPLGASAGDQVLVADDAQSLAAHIVKLLSSADERQALAERGHRFVLDRYSWTAAVEPLEHIFYAQLESK